MRFPALQPLPGESVHSISEGDHSLHIYGLILDPHHPDRSIGEIAQNLLSSDSLPAFLSTTFSLGGTYLLIWQSPIGTYAIPDSGALRPCFYYHRDGQMYLGSSAKGLYLQLPRNKQPPPEDTDFFKSAFAKNGLYVMGRTPWQGIRQLLPNHYLDLETGVSNRCFPVQQYQIQSTKSVLPELIKILRGQIKAAACHHTLTLPLTAGWDSRVLLAVSRPVLDRYSCTYTMRHPFMSDRHEDVRIPPKLAKRKTDFSEHVEFERCKKCGTYVDPNMLQI